MGIEPTFEAWEAAVLPLNHARKAMAGIARPSCIIVSVIVRRHNQVGVGIVSLRYQANNLYARA